MMYFKRKCHLKDKPNDAYTTSNIPSLPLMNSFMKTEAAFFLVQAMLPESFPFYQFHIIEHMAIFSGGEEATHRQRHR